jgi:hypothetical protein
VAGAICQRLTAQAEAAHVAAGAGGAAVGAPALAAVRNCIIAIAERVSHCAPQAGAEGWDTLGDTAPDRLWHGGQLSTSTPLTLNCSAGLYEHSTCR